jgi:membrane protein DedA with SNARE-associated domain
MDKGIHMIDTKALAGMFITAGLAGSTWVDQANAYGQLLLTAGGIVVAVLTAWYTWERARKLRKERKDSE